LPASDTSVTIIGASGAFGFGLALRLGRAGIEVTIGSRESARAEETVERLRERVPNGRFDGLLNGPAAAANELVVVSVPFRNHSETLTNLRESLRDGQVLLDTTVPLAAAVSGKATRMLGVWQGSAAQQAQEMVPDGVRVVSGLHSLSAVLLADLDRTLAEDVFVCGDRREDKERIAALIGHIDGLRVIDCGRLEMARIAESLTALLIAVNVRYKTHAGLRVTGLPAP
jgi:NADPH-dependent F420 reductase